MEDLGANGARGERLIILIRFDGLQSNKSSMVPWLPMIESPLVWTGGDRGMREGFSADLSLPF
jgi:hypothetical protein